MAVRSKSTGTALAMPAGIFLGVLIGIGLITITSFVLAWLIYTNRVGVSVLGYVSMGLLLISSAVGSLLAVRRVKRRRVLVGFLTGGGMYLVLLVINALLLGGHYQGAMMTGVMICSGSALAMVIGGREKGSGRNRKVKNGNLCKVTKW